jgi:hypothetical protein
LEDHPFIVEIRVRRHPAGKSMDLPVEGEGFPRTGKPFILYELTKVVVPVSPRIAPLSFTA